MKQYTIIFFKTKFVYGKDICLMDYVIVSVQRHDKHTKLFWLLFNKCILIINLNFVTMIKISSKY